MPPILEILFQIRLGLASGYSIRYAVEIALKKRSDCFSTTLKAWERLLLSDESPDLSTDLFAELVSTPGRRSFMKILERGYAGAPVDKALEGLIEELISEMTHQYQKKIQVLPIKLVLPMVLFILPAFFLLIIGPVFLSFERSWM